MLQVSQLHQYYGGSHILRGVDFSARQGEVTCLLGRNGVGKTTLLKCLMGLIPARSGEVRWQDQNITHRKPHQRVQAGVAYVPQGREIFPRLTVEENLLMGLATRPGSSKIPERIFEMFPVLAKMMHRRGGDLSGGQQQQLAIGRALAMGPKLLILDSPTVGVDIGNKQGIYEIVHSLADLGMSVLMISDEVPEVYYNCDRVLHMRGGQIIDEFVPGRDSEDYIREKIYA